jgi:cystathionine beta-lyase
MKKDTYVTHAGQSRLGNPEVVNTPVYRASTVLFDSVAHMHEVQAAWERDDPLEPSPTYAITDMPNQVALERAVAELEGGYRAMTFPSGMAAVAGALLAYCETGDHVLMVDSCYSPGRRFATRQLKRFGVEVEFYDPLIGAEIRRLMRPNTTVVYTESPGSHTFEIQDIPAISAVAHEFGATVIIDNAWATGYYFDAIAHGADVVVQPATKYIAGHSDLLLGVVVATQEKWPALRDSTLDLGQCAGPDELYLALRGMRTLGVRLAKHYENALAVAKWLQGRPEVARVLYPALPDDPGHALWKRDFTGATGLFGIELKPCADAKIAAMLDGYELFKLGYSWGGYESLVMTSQLANIRTVGKWRGRPVVRYHVGLESADDLIRDLERGFERLAR